jgi:ectoine hydroxylase-related dioxygenase (phytanoyl-CoA dioxygenase family)
LDAPAPNSPTGVAERINQDNVLWKPPGARSLGFHQDDSYQDWGSPSQMMTCWVTLDDTHATSGTIEYVRGSHMWPKSGPIKQFHAPDDEVSDMRAAARVAECEPDVVAIEVPAGSAVFHHGRTWHGSRNNHGSSHRRALVSHCMSSETTFADGAVSPVYGRYRRSGTNEMDESFFPIL